jgi:hypothetical protein
MVITEFDAGDPEATMHAMAEAILEYRRALRVLGRAVDLAKAGAPVAVIGPGPRHQRWRRHAGHGVGLRPWRCSPKITAH